MRTVECVELEDDDFREGEAKNFLNLKDDELMQASMAEVVIYRGDVIKNRNGRVTSLPGPNVKECIRAGGGGKTRFLDGGLTASWSDTLLLD